MFMLDLSVRYRLMKTVLSLLLIFPDGKKKLARKLSSSCGDIFTIFRCSLTFKKQICKYLAVTCGFPSCVKVFLVIDDCISVIFINLSIYMKRRTSSASAIFWLQTKVHHDWGIIQKGYNTTVLLIFYSKSISDWMTWYDIYSHGYIKHAYYFWIYN